MDLSLIKWATRVSSLFWHVSLLFGRASDRGHSEKEPAGEKDLSWLLELPGTW